MKDHKTEENKEIKKQKQNSKEGPLLERGRSQQIQKPRPGPENQSQNQQQHQQKTSSNIDLYLERALRNPIWWQQNKFCS